jgi:DEAD/DEAH box helicase domain-containing protein
LAIHDIAQIKSLLPELVRFAYIDPAHLTIHAEEEGAKSWSKQRERDEEYNIRKPGTDTPKHEALILVFEFNDGELNLAGKATKTGTT